MQQLSNVMSAPDRDRRMLEGEALSLDEVVEIALKEIVLEPVTQ